MTSEIIRVTREQMIVIGKLAQNHSLDEPDYEGHDGLFVIGAEQDGDCHMVRVRTMSRDFYIAEDGSQPYG